jgi:hypothetical protein
LTGGITESVFIFGTVLRGCSAQLMCRELDGISQEQEAMATRPWLFEIDQGEIPLPRLRERNYRLELEIELQAKLELPRRA